MTTPEPAAPSGAIYDLGYESYEGPRLGRRYALWSLYVLSLRNAFGIGRGALPKVLAFGMIAIAFMPAAVTLIIAAVVPADDFEVFAPRDYYGIIQFILVIFVAAIASDLVGNDRRTRTLSLYFSRPIERDDYALAKIAALSSSLLALTVLPQLVMFAGNALGASNSLDWARDNADDIPRFVASGLILCVMFGAVGILVASYAERRAFSLISVVAIFFISLTVVSIVIAAIDNDQVRWSLFLSPLHIVGGSTYYFFDAIPSVAEGSRTGDPEYQIAWADFPHYIWPLAALAWAALSSAVVVHRFRGSI